MRVFLLAGLLAVPVHAQQPAPPRHDCIVTPSRQLDLSSAVPGVLESVNVDRSDRVATGQVVARLRSGVELASLELARVRAELDTDIEQQGVQLEFDSQRRDRLEALHQQRAVSSQDRDRVERDAVLSRLRLRKAREDHTLRKIELIRAEAVVAEKIITSPIDGVVVVRYRSPGEYIEDQPVIRVVQLDPLHVEAILPMARMAEIRPGMEAEVVPELLDSEPLRATVTVVDPIGDAASGTFGIRLEMPNPDLRLPAGLKCTLTFQADLAATIADDPMTGLARVEWPLP